MSYVKDNTNVSISENRASADTGIFNMELLQIRRKRLHDNLVLPDQLINKQAIGFITSSTHIRIPSSIFVHASGIL